MTSRTRTSSREELSAFQHDAPPELDLDALSDDEIEAILFEEEEAEASSGLWNLPTMTGLSLILVGIVYLLQELDYWNGLDVSYLAATLPWLAGILIIFLGFGVLSWRPRWRKKSVRKGIEVPSDTEEDLEESNDDDTPKKRFTRSITDKKVFGVCGGIADYLNIEDATLVRIAFVVATVAVGAPIALAYLALAFALPKEEASSVQERVRIARNR